ncbi:ribose-phosphate pyrophosphokinase [Desulfonatronospira thiodismutans ASO3-1]|uniref:Ribose-phosphate pyrophosphokinase n=1 Tax=Desulfonatronospira thiodismutans ASO3-1 TaxID=555779 RepID=D6SUA8_9BACT|nr:MULTISPECIES: ribose-phosphate pyrophosphokinase [Desulfonatronospira]EFI32888.1 ribose-phosphate pyrophosphokinase [Desulfonatronospira thiodismutans ASO3-1]RQD79236.1 MAG: ribose-phosphate pyrophosphokinase [Desulfonatronospira sp. MSAO_Bac3]
MPGHRELKIITGNANPELARGICDHLGMTLSPTLVCTFSDGESRVEIGDNVRGDDVFVVQPTCAPVNHNILELCLMLDALKRASVGRVTAVIPYYGYARQDRKVVPRVPISAKLVADFISVSGVNRILTIDLHAGQIQAFFNIPVDNLFAAEVLLTYLKQFGDQAVVVSPDAGGTERARAYAKRIGAELAIIDKRRDTPNTAQAMRVIGDVKDKVAIVLDDMIDTGGTMMEASKVLSEKGASKVLACATHPVLSGPAIERMEQSHFSEIVVTDTIPLSEKARASGKFQVISVASLLAKAIHNIHTESSVSVLFSH